MTEWLKGALRLGVHKALGVVSMHYVINFEHLATGYIIPDGNDDAKVEAMEQADAGAEGIATILAGLFEVTSSLTLRMMKTRASTARGLAATCRWLGPRSPK